MILGKPQQYATVMPFGADAVGIPLKPRRAPDENEGNPDHPSSLRVGCLCAGFDSPICTIQTRENADVRGPNIRT